MGKRLGSVVWLYACLSIAAPCGTVRPGFDISYIGAQFMWLCQVL